MADHEAGLDTLCKLALAGDREAEERLFSNLRERFLTIGKRRVREDNLEDVVQQALLVVRTRLASRPDQAGTLPWSLTVLRHVIGNFYKAQVRLGPRPGPLVVISALEPPEPEGMAPDALETAAFFDQPEAGLADRLGEAMRLLAKSYPRCATIFRLLLESFDEGGSSHDTSQRALARARREFPSMTTAVAFHVALHRCRQRLRRVLKRHDPEDA